MSITLKTVRATCPVCGHVVSQIDTNQEHAVMVVQRAMRKHVKTHKKSDHAAE